jgi:hypothetical protein
MPKHCGEFIKCNNAEGCFGCEYEEDNYTEKDLHPDHPDNH